MNFCDRTDLDQMCRSEPADGRSGVEPNDPTTYVTVVAILFTVCLATSYLPARRASQIDPDLTLRQECRPPPQSIPADYPASPDRAVLRLRISCAVDAPEQLEYAFERGSSCKSLLPAALRDRVTSA